MAYKQQIRILESKLAQLKRGEQISSNLQQIWEIEANIRKLQRLEWEENYERIKMEEDR